MNKWILRSIQLANSKGYLDNLFEIYPVELGSVRDIPTNVRNEIQLAFKSGDKKNLIEKLLKLPGFPIDDPYIALMRRHPSFFTGI